MMVQKAKEYSFPYHELMPEAGVDEVLPSFEEMTLDEMFNRPSSIDKGQLEEYLMEDTKPLHIKKKCPP